MTAVPRSRSASTSPTSASVTATWGRKPTENMRIRSFLRESERAR